MNPRRHFIQHIGGEPILTRYVRYDSLTEQPDGSLAVDWTTDAADRQLWDVHADAKAVRARLGVGIVLADNPPDHLEPEEGVRLSAIAHNREHHRVAAAPEPPEDALPIADEDLQWWHK